MRGCEINHAEGAGRNSTAEFIRFLHIAKGSAAELRTQVYIAAKLKTKLKAQSSKLKGESSKLKAQSSKGILEKDTHTHLVDELIQVSSMLHALIKALKSTPDQPKPKT